MWYFCISNKMCRIEMKPGRLALPAWCRGHVSIFLVYHCVQACNKQTVSCKQALYSSSWMPPCIKQVCRFLTLGPKNKNSLKVKFRTALSLDPPHNQPSLDSSSDCNSRTQHVPCLCGHRTSLVFSLCGAVQRIHPGVATWVPSSPNLAWMNTKHYLSQVNFLKVPCPRWDETGLIFGVSRGSAEANTPPMPDMNHSPCFFLSFTALLSY